MIQRVMQAHHCYREKPKDADDEDLKGDEKTRRRRPRRRRPRRTTRPPGSGFPAWKPSENLDLAVS
jgi:hypothetical protein